ncbi:diguanylate cyclase/phosphodiesterase (GGDEF & EAL domains) with PAS/PAC sensor(s) [hydrothermal vent metagenome]|uniref:Diguanylate cyclase/phosphodiesterase (GGDEF & EAL domains) with PAS/PAC sensor(S) n=1 Tax=hydrothermal vent metagenome TaxID=652676 RepID=A0A1W1EF85_9ZZZZ
MNKINVYYFLKKQIILMIGLSLIPGLAYILLGWINNIIYPALLWYGLMLITSFFGWKLYKYNLKHMTFAELDSWYINVKIFFYVIFTLWTLIFVFYVDESEYKLHYIAIFTQIAASVIASIILVSDKKLFLPIISLMLTSLVIYFSSIEESYGYVLSFFTIILMFVLLYSSTQSFNLLQDNYYKAQYDPLTDLYNRRYFMEYIDHLLFRMHYHEKYAYILLIDLDYFKTINDTLGHEVGDKVLKEVSRRIERYCGKEYVVSRLGGDEFTIVSPEYNKSVKNINTIAYEFSTELLNVLKKPYYVDKHSLHISASIGINIMGGDKFKDAEQFIKETDIAMYEAKYKGRDGIVVFNNALEVRVNKQLEIERKLHFALENNEILLSYQPQFNQEKKIIGAEVLVRWENSDFGIISPKEFIKIAEETGTIIDLGKYIIDEAFSTLNEWQIKNIMLSQFSINISVRQFFYSSFVEDIKNLLKKFPNIETKTKIIFEITETLFIEDIDRITKIMNELRDLGIFFSIDDFGTGYSSLSSLRNMPIDEMKIDRSFVDNLGKQESDEEMLATILSLAKIFNLKIVAEGVETEEHFDFLLKHDCDYFQGYYFSIPLMKNEFEKYYLE